MDAVESNGHNQGDQPEEENPCIYAVCAAFIVMSPGRSLEEQALAMQGFHLGLQLAIDHPRYAALLGKLLEQERNADPEMVREMWVEKTAETLTELVPIAEVQ